LHFCRIGPKPTPPCSPRRLVALSRCPDAGLSLPGCGFRSQWHEGDLRQALPKESHSSTVLTGRVSCATRTRSCNYCHWFPNASLFYKPVKLADEIDRHLTCPVGHAHMPDQTITPHPFVICRGQAIRQTMRRGTTSVSGHEGQATESSTFPRRAVFAAHERRRSESSRFAVSGSKVHSNTVFHPPFRGNSFWPINRQSLGHKLRQRPPWHSCHAIRRHRQFGRREPHHFAGQHYGDRIQFEWSHVTGDSISRSVAERHRRF